MGDVENITGFFDKFFEETLEAVALNFIVVAEVDILARIIFCETEVLRILLLGGGFKLECSLRKGGATFLSLSRARAQRRKLNTPSSNSQKVICASIDRFSYEIADIVEMKFFKDKARGRSWSGAMTAERSEAARRGRPAGSSKEVS